MKKALWTVLFALFATLSAKAQTYNITPGLFNRDAIPFDINSIPVLSALVSNGAKLYFLGERSGLQGWFIVKDGQVQMIYITPDKKTAIIGGMFTNEGENVTGPQIQALANVNKEINELITQAGKQQEDIIKAGTEGGFAAVPGVQGSKPKEEISRNVPSVSLSPGERLMNDLRTAAGVTVGRNEKAEIIMVIGPRCPHCKATWRELKKFVDEGKVQVKLIPVINSVETQDINQSTDVKIGANLLAAENPSNAWNLYLEGDKTALSGEPEEIKAKAVIANSMLIERWNIRSTPYMVYRAKDGRVKIVQGEPQRMAAILNDLPR